MNSGTERPTTGDRRKHMRFDCPLGIMVKPSSDARSYVSGALKNFSRHGFCFEIQAIPLQEKENIEFRIKLPSEDRFTPVKGDIVWTRVDGDKLSAGVRINHMNGEDKCRILDFGYDNWIEKVIDRKRNSIFSMY